MIRDTALLSPHADLLEQLQRNCFEPTHYTASQLKDAKPNAPLFSVNLDDSPWKWKGCPSGLYCNKHSTSYVRAAWNALFQTWWEYLRQLLKIADDYKILWKGKRKSLRCSRVSKSRFRSNFTSNVTGKAGMRLKLVSVEHTAWKHEL